MKKIIAFILASILGMTLIACSAKEAPVADEEVRFKYSRNDDGTWTVTGAVNVGEEIVIPEEHEGAKVTVIGDYAFWKYSRLTSVIIPDSVTTIEAGAFNACSSLTNITIPDSVTSIGKSAFSGCDSLAFTEYNNAKYLGANGNPYFALLSSTESGIVTCEIHENTRIIADNAFAYGRQLTNITIPDSVISIGKEAFLECSSLTSVTIGKSVVSIGYSAFGNCKGLNKITIPNSVTHIGDHAFSSCGLTEITIPDSVTYIGDYAFGSSELTSVTIGNGVKSIGESTFWECNLTDVIIPSSVVSICEDAFAYCDKLTNIRFLGTMAQWRVVSKDENWDRDTGNYTIYCTDGEIKK